LQISVGFQSDAAYFPRNLRRVFSQKFAAVSFPQKFVTEIWVLIPLLGEVFVVCDSTETVANCDGFDFPSLNFIDPHYYDGFLQRRKIRQKDVSDRF